MTTPLLKYRARRDDLEVIQPRLVFRIFRLSIYTAFFLFMALGTIALAFKIWVHVKTPNRVIVVCFATFCFGMTLFEASSSAERGVDVP